jgi:hypothetical protein
MTIDKGYEFDFTGREKFFDKNVPKKVELAKKPIRYVIHINKSNKKDRYIVSVFDKATNREVFNCNTNKLKLENRIKDTEKFYKNGNHRVLINRNHERIET